MRVAELFVRCLESEGVRYAFGLPGEENEELLFALDGSSVTFVPTRHEQGAAFIANVWGRLTGRAGVCLSTLGPGATNLITGIADANLDKAPLVAITAQGGLDRQHHESHQRLDIVGMFKPIVKWNASISSPAIVTEAVRKAFKLAEAEKPGATHLELPEDVAELSAPPGDKPLPRRRVRRPDPDPVTIAEAIRLLKKARRPLILAGNGAIRKLASAHLTRFAERFGIPVASSFMGKGAISDDNPLSLMAVGLGFKDYVIEAFDNSDLVVTIGYDIAEYMPDRWNPQGDKTIVHVDFDPAEVYSNYVPEVEIVGDISASIRALGRELEGEKTHYDDRWFAPIRSRIVKDIRSYTLKDDAAFTIPGVVNIVRETLADDGLLISDVGSHKLWIARNFPTRCPNGCIVSNGLASMGIALPGAIAASLANPGRPIVALMGDGGFLINSQELETAKRLGAAFTVIVVNDNDYGLISWKQRMGRRKSVGTRITNPDFKAYAESFGLHGLRPRGPAEFRAQLRKTLKRRELAVIEIPVDTAVNDTLLRKLDRYWRNDP